MNPKFSKKTDFDLKSKFLKKTELDFKSKISKRAGISLNPNGKVILALAFALSIGGYNTTNNLFVMLSSMFLAFLIFDLILLNTLKKKLLSIDNLQGTVIFPENCCSFSLIPISIKLNNVDIHKVLPHDSTHEASIFYCLRNDKEKFGLFLKNKKGRDIGLIQEKRRGIYTLSNLILSITRGTGLFRLELRLDLPRIKVPVHPKIHLIKKQIDIYAPISSRDGELLKKSQKSETGIDYLGLNPWLDGEEIRRIDWKASAKTGKMVQRILGTGNQKSHRIILDLHNEDEEALENAISFAAGLAKLHIQNGNNIIIKGDNEEIVTDDLNKALTFLAKIDYSPFDSSKQDALVGGIIITDVKYSKSNPNISDDFMIIDPESQRKFTNINPLNLPDDDHFDLNHNKTMKLIEKNPAIVLDKNCVNRDDIPDDRQEKKLESIWQEAIYKSLFLAALMGIMAHILAKNDLLLGIGFIMLLFSGKICHLFFRDKKFFIIKKAIKSILLLLGIIAFIAGILSAFAGIGYLISVMGIFLSLMVNHHLLDHQEPRKTGFILLMTTVLLSTGALNTTGISFMLWLIIFAFYGEKCLHLLASWPNMPMCNNDFCWNCSGNSEKNLNYSDEQTGNNKKIKNKDKWLAIVSITIILFFIIPRPRIQLLKLEQSSGQTISGFTDDATFGQLGEIGDNSQVVMRLISSQPDYLRGLVYDTFDGKGWTLYNETVQNRHRDMNGRITFAYPPGRSGPRYSYTEQDIYLEDYDLDVLFAYWQPERIEVINQSLMISDQDIIRVPPGSRRPSHYKARSRQVRNLQPFIMPDRGIRNAHRYLQLPHLMPDIAQLARTYVGDERDLLEMARLICEGLKNDYEYSTAALNVPPDTDMLTNFLFISKKGHCEYFATAGAVLLRSLGVPCRYITGFYPHEYNEIGDYWIIRQDSAHAWIEVYTPNNGWVIFDPTPEVEKEINHIFINALIMRLDWLRLQWQRYIIGYSRVDQLAIISIIWEKLREIARLFGKNTKLINQFLERKFGNRMLSFVKFHEKSFSLSLFHEKYRPLLKLLMQILPSLFGLISILFLFYISIKWILEKRLKKSKNWFFQIMENVEKIANTRMNDDETPLEFSRNLDYPLSEICREITELYYGEKFGNMQIAREKQEILRKKIENIRNRDEIE